MLVYAALWTAVSLALGVGWVVVVSAARLHQARMARVRRGCGVIRSTRPEASADPLSHVVAIPDPHHVQVVPRQRAQ